MPKHILSYQNGVEAAQQDDLAKEKRFSYRLGLLHAGAFFLCSPIFIGVGAALVKDGVGLGCAKNAFLGASMTAFAAAWGVFAVKATKDYIRNFGQD